LAEYLWLVGWLTQVSLLDLYFTLLYFSMIASARLAAAYLSFTTACRLSSVTKHNMKQNNERSSDHVFISTSNFLSYWMPAINKCKVIFGHLMIHGFKNSRPWNDTQAAKRCVACMD
jgi:hypothetical protein